MTWDSASYMTAKQKKAQAAKRAKQRQQEREQAHLKKIDTLVGQWMAETTTVLRDEQKQQQTGHPTT
jgi:hypothetical protein